jgi:hypothetical protein
MTNAKMNFYYVNVCKCEHKKKMSRLWCKIVPRIGAEQTKGNKRSYFYLYICGKLAQRNFQGGFYVCIKMFFKKLFN